MLLGCSSGDDAVGDPNQPAPTPEPTESPTGSPTAEPAQPTNPAQPTEPPAEPTPLDEATAATVEIARDWIERSSGLSSAMGASVMFAGIERTGNVSHVRFSQAHDGVRVEGGELIVHVLADGTVQGATSSLSEAEPEAGAASEASISAEQAIAIATKAVTGSVGADPQTDTVWVEDGKVLRLAQRVALSTTDPLGTWTVFVDAATGAVISAERVEARSRPHAAGLARGANAAGSVAAGSGMAKLAVQSGDRCVLPPAPAACVFVPDPIYAAGGALPSTAAANDFLTGVPLLGLDDPASGALVGEFANLEPSGAPIDPVREPDGLWGAGRGAPGFEAQNTYYWIDYGQRIVQRLGFDDLLNTSFPVVPIDPATVDNAFYSPGERRIYLGVGSNGIHEGEDATGILHEYGHALLDDVNRNLLATGDIAAYHESFGDLFAVLTTIEFRTGDWPCFFLWTDQACLRRMDNTKTYPRDLTRQIHADGEIYSGAVIDVFAALLAEQGIDIDDCPGSSACNDVRDRVLTTVLASNYYLTANMSLPDIAASFIQANDAQFGGADAELIEQAFAGRGLTGGSGTLLDGGGVRNGSRAALEVEIDIAHSFRGDLRVTVGVTDAAFDDLCGPIVLFEPDPNDGERDLSGRIDVSDSDCAAFAEPGPDRVWYLFVEDTVAADEGEILGFSVIADGTTYLAPGLPLPIADADPTGTVALIDGSTDAMAPETMSGLDSAEPGRVAAQVALTHTYHGDLSIRVGVVDEDSTILCSVPILEPDPADAESGPLSGDIDVDRCAEFYPPSPQQQWFLQVIDTAAEDTGTVEAFSVTGPGGATHDFVGVPVDIPDDDVDGIALLLDGGAGSSGQAGGSGQTSDVALPSVSVAIRHPYAGDLAVTSGVVDGDGAVVCEVTLATPDANVDTADLSGDASLDECARFYPPQPDRRWFLFVADTLDDDVGAVERFSLTGPDGAVYTSAAPPVDIPDADPDGVALYFDGSELGVGDMIDPVVSLVVSHPYVGDLDVRVGVLDDAGDERCATQVAEADIDNNGIDLALEVPLGECREFYPPTPEQRWFAEVIDNFESDRGTIDAFALYGPDGRVWMQPDGSTAIPDADADGATTPATVVIDGSGGARRGASRSTPVAEVEIAHSDIAELRVSVGLIDAEQNILCRQSLLEPGSDTASAAGGGGVALRALVADCAELYPPIERADWFLLVVDDSPGGVGTIERFAITGPDGRTFDYADLPVPIPDDDPDGIAVVAS